MHAIHATRRTRRSPSHTHATAQHDTTRTTLLTAAVASCLFVLGCPVPASAQSGTQTQSWNLASGPLDTALKQLAVQSRLQIVYSPDLVAGKTTRGLAGQHTPAEALKRLLAGTGLTWDALDETTFVLRRAPVAPAGPAAVPPAVPVVREEAKVTDMDAMTVTGSRIRGGSSPSPVITIGFERIQEEGFSDLGEVIRSVPQNFTGGQNPGVLSLNLAGAGHANNNLTGGSSPNLRGLGPDATLTLLNGRRMAYGGFTQAVDVSTVPVEAVERIEVVADGASAIYGSDAVGGVVNVILRKNYEGVKVSALHGRTTSGGLGTREYTVTAGTTWQSGSLIATYKDASVDPIYASDRSYTAHLTSPTTIYPASDLRSWLLSIRQSLGDVAEVRLDALRTEREQLYNSFNANGMNNRVTPETTTSLVAPSIDFALPNDWTLSVGAARAKDVHNQLQSWENMQTGASTRWLHECFCNESRSYEVGAEGPLFALSGGDARLAVGGGYRTNEFQQFNRLTNANMTRGEESSRFAYAEIGLPVVRSESNIAGVERLTLTAAARAEDYDTFGSVTTPKIGLIWGPNANLTVKTSWGESYKAPTLFQRNNALSAFLYFPQTVGGTGYPSGSTVLYLDGGNQDLEAERARTWTASLALHPVALPSFQAELTWFQIRYTDRVVQPIANARQALSNPIYAQFISLMPSAGEQAVALERTDRFVNSLGVAYDPANVVAILYGQYINVARQEIRGLDLSGSYWLDLGAGRLTLRGAVSWLDSRQQVSEAQDTYDLSGTLHNPAKFNGRIGAVWSQGGLSLSSFANYTGGVTSTIDGGKPASFTTFDATLRYSVDADHSPWSGFEFAIAAQNLLDREPPLYTPTRPLYVPPYDSTNYSPIGRYLSVSVAKHWR